MGSGGWGVWGVGCGVWGVGCGVWGVGVWGCGVWGVGCGVIVFTDRACFASPRAFSAATTTTTPTPILLRRRRRRRLPPPLPLLLLLLLRLLLLLLLLRLLLQLDQHYSSELPTTETKTRAKHLRRSTPPSRTCNICNDARSEACHWFCRTSEFTGPVALGGMPFVSLTKRRGRIRPFRLSSNSQKTNQS